MITYEITASVQAEVAERYEAYMRERHIKDVLATGYFESAAFTQSGPGRYRVRYEAYDQEALERYLAECAAELRQHFIDHLPEGVELSRENWTVMQSWRSGE
jgi:hypothetical protein